MTSRRSGSRRRYDSPRRREQAEETRRAILEAAQRLFERHGYVATTMAAIAGEAGVALKTVYVAFDTKAGVLRGLWNLLLRGDERDAPVAERAWYREALEEPDPERQLRLLARNSRDVKLRIGVVLEVIRSAAPTDPDIEMLWRQIRTDFLANQRAIVERLEAREALAPGLNVDRATEMLWAINLSNLWQLLVGERGWTPEQYETWIGDVACSQLLSRTEREWPSSTGPAVARGRPEART
jgi:AcrR family transcriptional regulator